MLTFSRRLSTSWHETFALQRPACTQSAPASSYRHCCEEVPEKARGCLHAQGPRELAAEAAEHFRAKGDTGRADKLTARIGGRNPPGSGSSTARTATPELARPSSSAHAGGSEAELLGSLRALIAAAGRPEQVASFAAAARTAAVFKAAADHLAGLDWPAQPQLASHIMQFYRKVRPWKSELPRPLLAAP